jgi:hypothetical protein
MRVHRARPAQRRARVSVVIPCYNYGHFLPAAVASALDQDGVDVDVLIVDDASPDGSAEVARSLASGDPRVKVLVHDRNRGHIATYNDGLARATGDYVVLLSADDLLTPHSLSRSVALMESHPDVVLVYGYAVEFELDPPEQERSHTWWSTWTGEQWLGRVCARGRNIIVNPEAVMRTHVMKELGGYRPEHPHAADLEVWMRAAARGGVGRVNGPAQAAYRVHGSNMHVTTYGGALADAKAVRAVLDGFFGPSGDGHSLAGASRLGRQARRAVAREALLASCQRGVSSQEAAALIDMARETSSTVTRTPAWLVHQVSAPIAPQWCRRALTRAEELRWALRWRRWRRFGT